LPVYRKFIREWGEGRVLLRRLIFFVLIVSCFFAFFQLRVVNGKRSAVAKKSARLAAAYFPHQSDLDEVEPLTFGRLDFTWRVYPKAGYRISARILQITKYDDWQAEFSPVDMALGWGLMSDPEVDRWVDVQQADRWYFYRKAKDAPFSLEEVRNSSANVHIIPADDSVAAVVEGLTPNDMVLMEGKLVDVEIDRFGELFEFNTSLTRLDSDEDSCEIFYVERVVVVGEGE
jgi:hypothetical protein